MKLIWRIVYTMYTMWYILSVFLLKNSIFKRNSNCFSPKLFSVQLFLRHIFFCLFFAASSFYYQTIFEMTILTCVFMFVFKEKKWGKQGTKLRRWNMLMVVVFVFYWQYRARQNRTPNSLIQFNFTDFRKKWIIQNVVFSVNTLFCTFHYQLTLLFYCSVYIHWISVLKCAVYLFFSFLTSATICRFFPSPIQFYFYYLYILFFFISFSFFFIFTPNTSHMLDSRLWIALACVKRKKVTYVYLMYIDGNSIFFPHLVHHKNISIYSIFFLNINFTFFLQIFRRMHFDRLTMLENSPLNFFFNSTSLFWLESIKSFWIPFTFLNKENTIFFLLFTQNSLCLFHLVTKKYTRSHISNRID